HALHDLDPVAGRVLRRKQRERRAGAGAEAGDRAVVSHLAAVEIGAKRYRLPEAHRGELRLLVVCIDPDLVERDDRHQRRARAHALPELDRALGDETADGRGQLRSSIREISIAHALSRVTTFGLVLDSCAYGS